MPDLDTVAGDVQRLEDGYGVLRERTSALETTVGGLKTTVADNHREVMQALKETKEAALGGLRFDVKTLGAVAALVTAFGSAVAGVVAAWHGMVGTANPIPPAAAAEPSAIHAQVPAATVNP